MSRIPQPSRTRSPAKPPTKTLVPPGATSRATSPSKTTTAPSTPTRLRSKTPTKSLASRSNDEPPTPKVNLTIKEAIALKRAEARKILPPKNNGGSSELDTHGGPAEDTTSLPLKGPEEEEDATEIGRWSIKESIDRARSTGSINLSTRSLLCLPSALFQIHLGITPDSLGSVPEEPRPSDVSRGDKRQDAPAWFESQDLQVLKAWNNQIIEVQPEISLFGSLKTIDLHGNKIVTLPDTFADLMSLVSLDISHNALVSLPSQLFSLPSLTNLNISHNSLTALPFTAPFVEDPRPVGRASHGGSFFTPTITRTSSPLPLLLTLDASYNKIIAASIDHIKSSLPARLSKFDLSGNPLGMEDPYTKSLVQSLGNLTNLKQLNLAKTKIGDDSFVTGLWSGSALPTFPSLKLLDLGETRVTAEAVARALHGIRQELTFDLTTEEPPVGTLRIIVGKPVLREAWEVEADKNTKARPPRYTAKGAVIPPSKPITKKTVQKESWEFEAEQGLLTEGGRRRARAAAAASAEKSLGHGTPSTPHKSASPVLSGNALTACYSQNTQTLDLPSSAPLAKGHNRAASLASSSLISKGASSTAALALPTPTLPLAAIASQTYAQSLRVLKLANRRMDVSFNLPENGVEDLLPNLEELNIEGCGLTDSVVVTYVSPGVTTRSSEPLLPLISRLFPSLYTLDLSFNALTVASLSTECLSALILGGDTDTETPQKRPRRGLRHLRLRGNRLTDVSGLQDIAELFKGNRSVPRWKLEELDIRENDISKLPPDLGLLPLDVFLVEGNAFRVPQRRVWEREGTKGLLSWLRGRIE